MAICTETFVFEAENPTEYLAMKAYVAALLLQPSGLLSPYSITWKDSHRRLTLAVTVSRSTIWELA